MTDRDDSAMIDPDTLSVWMRDGAADLYDVREAPEIRLERIAGSAPAPLSAFDPLAVTAGPGRKLVLHCKSGVRCGIAARIMRAAGVAGPIYRLAGGIEAWKAAGGATEPGDS